MNNNSDSLTESNQNQDKSVDPNFSITFNEIGFFTDKKDSTDYEINPDFYMTNNTGKKLTRIKVAWFLEVGYKGEKIQYQPDMSGRDYKSEDDYCSYEPRCNYCVVNCVVEKTDSISGTQPWLPGTSLRLNYPYGSGGSVKEFERTPETLMLVIKYDASGVDGDYSNKIRFNLIDKWKEYQTKLGLR